jgi:hypothetical protein
MLVQLAMSYRGDRVTLFRNGNQYEFVQDERWYEKNGRRDCIWTLPRPGGVLYEQFAVDRYTVMTVRAIR